MTSNSFSYTEKVRWNESRISWRLAAIAAAVLSPCSTTVRVNSSSAAVPRAGAAGAVSAPTTWAASLATAGEGAKSSSTSSGRRTLRDMVADWWW
jgi:hypothetical protein